MIYWQYKHGDCMKYQFTDSGYSEKNRLNPPIVLVHGFFMNSNMFTYQVDALKEKHRIICINVRGFDINTDQIEPYSLYDIVNDILKIADLLHLDKFILGGMSMGGYISLRFALSHPERLAGLILIATQAEQDPPDIASNYIELCNGWQVPTIKENIISSLLPIFFGNNKPEAEKWREIWLQHKSENIKLAMNAMLERDNISHKIHNIDTPTLIIHGSSDSGIPLEKAMKMQKMINHSKLEVIPDAHHALNITHANEVNRIINDWLTETTYSNHSQHI